MAGSTDSEKASSKHAKEAEHFSLKDIESFVEVAELLEEAVKGRISAKELERKLTARIPVEGRDQAAAQQA